MKRQLKMLGLSVDWDKEISTCDEELLQTSTRIIYRFFIIKDMYLEKKIMLIGTLLIKQFLQTNKLLMVKDGVLEQL